MPFVRVLSHVCKQTFTQTCALCTRLCFCLSSFLVLAFSSINAIPTLTQRSHVSILILFVQTMTSCAFFYLSTVLHCNFDICISPFKFDKGPAELRGKYFATTQSVWRLGFSFAQLHFYNSSARSTRTPCDLRYHVAWVFQTQWTTLPWFRLQISVLLACCLQ